MKNLNELIEVVVKEKWNKEKVLRIVNTPVQFTIKITDVDSGFIGMDIYLPYVVGELPGIDYSVVFRVSHEYYNNVAIEFNIDEYQTFLGHLFDIDTNKKEIYIQQTQ